MKNLLLVPMWTDALFLSKDSLVTEATADFSSLPYFNGTRDVNADVANVSESIVSQPLQDQNLRLRKGLHLHWALPDAMNRGRHLEDGKTEFPIVPNRWLVTRYMNDKEKSWVVESDYLFPEDKHLTESDPRRKARRESITVPVEISGRESGEQPFRYMGRTVEAEKYNPSDKSDRYPKLTTVGYGEPSFAAFYPNCHSVFGFHDHEIEEGMKPTYNIIGWYSDEEQDFFKKLTEGSVLINLQQFSDNLTQYSEAVVDGLWTQLLKNQILDGSIDSSSPVEKALVVPPHEWPSNLLDKTDEPLLQALHVVLDALDQYIQKRTGWDLRHTVSQADLKGQDDKLWQKMHDAGWLEMMPGQEDISLLTARTDRPEGTLDFIDDEDRFNIEKLMIGLQMQHSPRQVILHSCIKVDIDVLRPKEEIIITYDPETFEEKIQDIQTKTKDAIAENISVVIGNTGTEALSVYLANALNGNKINEDDFFAQAFKKTPDIKHQILNLLIEANWIRKLSLHESNVIIGINPKTQEESVIKIEGYEIQPKEKRSPFPSGLKQFKSEIVEFFDNRVDKMAEQLEALYLLDKLDHRILDMDAKFDEARHENGFNAVASGHHWTITVASRENRPANAQQTAERPELPTGLAELLNDINGLQWEYDRNRARLDSLGTQLYADWYKYMLSTYPPEDTRTDYPDIDEVRYFIEIQVMEAIQKLHDETGLLILEQPEKIRQGSKPARSTGGFSGAIAKKLALKLNDLFRKLNELNASLSIDSDIFMLQRTGGPRYYEPREPVILLANSDENNLILQPTCRHGQDGHLACYVFPSQNNQSYLSEVEELSSIQLLIDRLSGTKDGNEIGINVWSGQPWNPFRLDWEVELVPLAEKTNLEEKPYDQALVNSNFSLPVNGVDLEPIEQKIASYRGRNPNIYVGKSLLTPQAKHSLKERLRTYLEEKIPHDEWQQFLANPTWVFQQWATRHGKDDPITASALLAYIHLQNENLYLLSQSLSGFNDAMLQLRQSYQLPITDPIGFKDYLPFTEQVATLAELSTHLAPQPLTDFNPIRTGEMVINQLRLIDTFGQKRDIDLGKLDRVIGGNKVTEKKDSVIKVPLQPRLAQPARLNFRWLSAGEGTQEMNAVPGSSPICGWILTNQLDDSLVIYDREGQMLGSIEAKPDPVNAVLARWNPAPGALQPVLPEAIENEFLRKMVANIRSGGEYYVRRFIDGLDTVLRTIEPENFESQQALSLLIGRPVALVRASINLELQGMPAVDQGWHAFYQDREDGDAERNRDNFTEVEFPVRLGKHDQFNDGLVGYWKENETEKDGTTLSDDFYLNYYADEFSPDPVSPGMDETHEQSENQDSAVSNRIKLLKNKEVPIYQSITAEPQLVSMLIDPRGKVHATTGILPVKEIDLPAEQYLPAMQQMAVTFLTAPLLTPAANVQSLLPTVEGYEWSWIERTAAASVSQPVALPSSFIDRNAFQKALADGILTYLQEREWVSPIDADMWQFFDDGPPLEGQFNSLDTDLFSVLEDVSTEQTREDGSIELFFSRRKFEDKLSKKNEPGCRVWNQLNKVGWIKAVSGREDILSVEPSETGIYQIPEDFAMASLIGEIVQQLLKDSSSNTASAPPVPFDNNWREVFIYPTIERSAFQQAFAEGVLVYLTERGWTGSYGVGFYQFTDNGSELEGDFEQHETVLFGILEEISREQPLEDGGVDLYFSKKDFVAKLSHENELGGQAWNILVRSDVQWCEFIPGRPDTFRVRPLKERNPKLPGIGLEVMVEGILQKHQQILTEPTPVARFTDTPMTLREGYLNLEKVKNG